MPEVGKLKIKHEAIMDWMLANPTATYADVSREFGMSITWLSILVNSDSFKAKLKEKQGVIFESVVLEPLETKVKAAAEMAINRLTEKVQYCESVDSLANTADKLLGRLGYGAPKSNGNGNGAAANPVNVSVTLLQEARGLIGRQYEGELDDQRRTLGAPNPPPSIPHAPAREGEETRGIQVRAEGAPLDGEEV